MATRHPERYREMLNRLKAARLERGLTQSDVATVLGESQQWFSLVEIGSRRLDPLELAELAEIYQYPIEHFIPPEPKRRR